MRAAGSERIAADCGRNWRVGRGRVASFAGKPETAFAVPRWERAFSHLGVRARGLGPTNGASDEAHRRLKTPRQPARRSIRCASCIDRPRGERMHPDNCLFAALGGQGSSEAVQTF